MVCLITSCVCSIEPGDEVVIPTPTFSYYEIAARANGATAIHVAPGEGLKFDITAIKEAITERTKVVFLCSPNNPTGLLTSEDDVRSLLESTNGLVFVDEAYVEFSDKSLSKLVLEYDNLVIGRTFSKAFGLAGLRIGYGLMPEWLKVQYMKIATPFNVSLPAVMAGVAALSDSEYLEKSISMTVEGRKFLTENIPFKVYDSRANFILVDCLTSSRKRCFRIVNEKRYYCQGLQVIQECWRIADSCNSRHKRTE